MSLVSRHMTCNGAALKIPHHIAAKVLCELVLLVGNATKKILPCRNLFHAFTVSYKSS